MERQTAGLPQALPRQTTGCDWEEAKSTSHSQMISVYMQALSLPGCVTLDKLLKFSVLSLLSYKIKKTRALPHWIVVRFK